MIQWQKSSFSSGSDGSNCLELAAPDGTLLLRESDDPTQILSPTGDGLAALIRGVKSGAYGLK